MKQRPDILKMQKRLKAALANPHVRELVHQDLMHTFMNLGLGNRTRDLVAMVINRLATNTHLERTESYLRTFFKCTYLEASGNLLHVLDEKMKDRAQIVYGQVSKFFRQDEVVIDWGCGDGQVTNYVYNHITHKIEGWDVRHYPALGIVVPIKRFDGSSIPISNGYFDAGLMTNVAHHEKDNGKILRELARIIRPGGRLVVIETVPIRDDPNEFERTFVGDYVYNRLFHNADIPVPGTYETEFGWIQRFLEVGFELEVLDDGTPNPTPLGYDQETIRDWHTRLVLRRNKTNRM